jgi:hypothetical protein
VIEAVQSHLFAWREMMQSSLMLQVRRNTEN